MGRRTGASATLGLLGLGLAAAIVGSAASLALSSATLGAGRSGTAPCTTAGLTVVPNLTASAVSSVTVGGLPAACGSASIQATVTSGALSGSGSATVPAAGGSVTITLGTQPLLTASTRTDIVLAGP